MNKKTLEELSSAFDLIHLASHLNDDDSSRVTAEADDLEDTVRAILNPDAN